MFGEFFEGFRVTFDNNADEVDAALWIDRYLY